MGILDGRVAVVTGSGRGIGREFALCLASEGAKLVVVLVVVARTSCPGLPAAGVGAAGARRPLASFLGDPRFGAGDDSGRG